jgi:cytochrome c2
MMHGTPGMRLALGILSPIFLALWVLAIYSEETQPWMRYQDQFNRLYVEQAKKKLDEATARTDEKEVGRWQRLIEEFSAAKPEIQQVYLNDIKVADRCTTCHRGVTNSLFADAPEPFKTHPGKTLNHHDFNVFGCTPCHQGQGEATTVSAAHGKEESWLKPLLPTVYIESTCANCHEVTHGVEGAEVITRGGDLFMENGCYGCHDAKDYSYRPRFSPPLNGIKSKLRDVQRFTYNWVKEPKKVSPDTAMPNFRLKDEDLGYVVAFLLTLPEGEKLEPVSLDNTEVEDGKRLFQERGCRGCHAIKTDEHSVTARVPHLAGIGSKVTKEWLAAWIKDPKKLNPDTAMPTIQLIPAKAAQAKVLPAADAAADPNAPAAGNDAAADQPDQPKTPLSPPLARGEEKGGRSAAADPKLEEQARRNLVAYLVSAEREQELPSAPDLKSFDPQKGKELVKKYECFGCHSIKGFEEARPAVPDVTEFARRPVTELDFGNTTEQEVPRTKWDWVRRKLSDPRLYEKKDVQLFMPGYDLTDDQTHALVAYSVSMQKPNLPSRYMVRRSDATQALRDMSWIALRLNCRGCHRLKPREDPYIAKFLERKTLAGPNLQDVGARLQGQYLYEFLQEPKRVRPWLLMQMPTFNLSEEVTRLLVAGFAADQHVVNPHTYVAKAAVQDEHFARGVRRFRHFKCMQCHPTSIDQGLPKDVDPDDLSINLMLTKERCRPEWLRDFMARPKQIAGNDTRMPTVFYTVDGVPKVEKPDKDINDITVYMMGMVEPPELTVAAEEAAIAAETQVEQETDWTKYNE